MGLENEPIEYMQFLNPTKGIITPELVNVFSLCKQLDNNIKYLYNYLSQQGRKFDFNEKNFFKKENKIHKNFRSLSIPKQKLTPEELAKIATDTIGKKAILGELLDILNTYTNTDFIISGIQHAFTPSRTENKSIFLHQPVIRLNGSGQGNFFVSGEQGIATSFVNTTTYKINANIEDILEGLEELLNFFNKIGMYIGDISLKLQIEEDERNREKMFIFMLHVFYGNLEIGDTSLIEGNKNQVIIKDLGFGLERVNLARNKFTNYFEQYLTNKKYLERFSDMEIDAIKTLCLIQTSGRKELLKNSGLHTTYCKLLKKLNKEKNYYPLIKVFIDYRKNFLPNANNRETVLLDDIETYS